MMKKNYEQADLSSSEDEVFINVLKDSIDQQFLNDDLYNMDKTKAIPQSESKTNKLDKNYSRISSRQEDKFTNFGFTPTLQSFIAKKLDEILERTIELESSEITNCDEQKRRKDKSSGIKLLSTSKKLLTIAKVEEYKDHKKRPKRNPQIIEDDEALSKFREAAVDPEYILSKLDTKAWVNKRPEPEFKYKRSKNDILIEM